MAKKNLGGRPSEMSAVRVKKLEEVFAIDGTVEEACFYADISKQTYYNWLEKNPKLVDRFKALREKPILKARRTMIKSLEEPTHAKWYLERKKKKEFGANIDVTTDGKPIPLLHAVANEVQSNNSNPPSDGDEKED
jgi:hypothetical protein